MKVIGVFDATNAVGELKKRHLVHQFFSTWERAIGTMLLLIGAMNAAFQSLHLWNDLVGTYPYKMMSSPPAEYYSDIGTSLLLYAWPVSVAIGLIILLSRPSLRYVAGFVPVLLCPVIYVAHLQLSIASDPYREYFLQVNGVSGQILAEDYLDFSREAWVLFQGGVRNYFQCAVIIGIIDIILKLTSVFITDPHPPPRP